MSDAVLLPQKSSCKYLLVLIAVFCTLAYAQTPAPTSPSTSLATAQEAIRKNIENAAIEDAKAKIDIDLPEVHRQFDADGARVGLSRRQVLQIYKKAYDDQTAKQSNLFDRIWQAIQSHPQYGWIAAVLIFLWGLFRETIENTISEALKAIKDRIYNRFAGNRYFHRIRLRRYQSSLIKKYQRLRIPFRQDQGLDMRKVYVPLKVAGSSDRKLIEASQAIIDYRRLIVLGPPGSGKSMLLRRIALNYADRQFNALPEAPMPILLELHRLNDPTVSLEQHLVEELKRNDFPCGERFVAQNLEHSTLMLLLDGLDEVNTSERGRVVQAIKDLLGQHEQCRATITCRTAVYRDELLDIADRTLEIVELSDQQIRGFLRLWWISNKLTGKSGMEEKSVEHLMQTLDDRPSIKMLARNPLLLTIITYLYTNTPLVLPQSRAEFYSKSTDILLEQWDELRHLVPNKYTATQKRLALQHLALHHQTNADRQQRDGRSMEYTTVLEQLGKVLPGLNLKPEQDIQPMLDEIVQRSGLLLRIDGGQRYQFAHLTLQEYFAAAQLTARVRELIELFREERDAWRETVKLWCGLSTDSTELIQAVYNVDQLTAFECLADAQKVDPCLATEILESFKARLGEADAGDRVARAFGAVAAASTPRGIVAFDFLKGALTRPDAPAQQTTAAHALSFTNLPRAATMLAAHRADGPEVGAALIRMGDLAVPALKVLADAGDISALSDLQAIGTPRAAEVLFPLLWHEAPSLARQTAWCLAVLLSKPEIEEALRNYTLTEEQRRAPQLGWVWEPFMEREPVNSALPVIAGRIAYLIDHALLNSNLAPQPADPRLIIPLCAVKRQPIEIHFKDKTSPELVEVVSRVLQLDEKKRGEIQADICWLAPGDTFGDTLDAMATLAKTNEFPDVASLRETFIKATSFSDADSQWQRLMNCLPLDIKFDLLYRLLKGPQPTQSDWRNLFRPIQYSFARSWHFLLVVGATLPISLVGLVQIYVTIAHSETFFTWANAGLVAAVLMDAWFWLMTLALMEADSFLMLLTGPIGALYSHSFLPSTGLFGALYPRSFLNIAEITMDLTIALVLCLPSTTVLYFATRYGLNFLSESQIVLTSLIPSFAAMPYGLPATAANVLPEIRSMAS